MSEETTTSDITFEEEIPYEPVPFFSARSVIEELQRSFERPELSDCWSDLAASVYFDAASFHGLEVVAENIPDIYSYAMEAAEALSKMPVPLHYEFEYAQACRDWYSGVQTRADFLARVVSLCEKESGHG